MIGFKKTKGDKTMGKLERLYDFIEKVNAGEESFSYTNNYGRNIHFISCKYGNAKCFFACEGNETGDFISTGYEYKLVAIVACGKIYVVDWWTPFNIWYNAKDIELPENVIDFFGFNEEMNRILFDDIYPDYYEKLKTTKTNSERFNEERMIPATRQKIFTGKENIIYCRETRGITSDETIRMLCNNLTIQDVGIEILEKQKETIDYIKSKDEIMQNLIDSGKVAQPWEISLANSINSAEAKTVNVEFEFNGQTATVKLEGEKILSVLIYDRNFDCYDFPSRSIGEKFLYSIKAYSCYHCYSKEKWKELRPTHIKSISFRGKKIYEKPLNDNIQK